MVCKKCGNSEFIAHQVLRADIVVDGNNNFLRNMDWMRPCMTQENRMAHIPVPGVAKNTTN